MGTLTGFTDLLCRLPRRATGLLVPVGAVLALFVSLAARVEAQTGGAGILAGRVTDPTGGVLPGARIELVGPSKKSAASDASGAYRIGNLNPGRYTVVVTKERFAAFARGDVTINAGQVTTLDAALELAPITEQLTVDESRGLSLDEQDSAGAIVIKGKDLEALPDDPDELADALQALAGPAAGPDGGQIYIDGFSGGQLPPKTSIREIRINASPFSAEFDRMGWGRIEIFTKPGTDKLRGEGRFGFNDETLNSRNPFAPNRPPYQYRDWDLDLGGPLISKKASYFIDAGRRDTDDNDLIKATILDGGLDPTPYSLAVMTPQHRTSLSPRLDWQLGDRHSLTARYSYSYFERPQSGIGDYSLLSRAYDSWNRRQSFQLGDTVVISKSVANETRLQYAWSKQSSTGDITVPTLDVLGAFTGGGSQVGDSYSNDGRFELQNITSWTHGRHTMRAGFRVRGMPSEDVSQRNFGGTVTFSGGLGPLLDAHNQPLFDASGQMELGQLTSIERYRRTVYFQQQGLSPSEIRALGGGASQLRLSGGDPSASITQWDMGPFVQDDWRVSKAFTLSLGLRYENQTNVSSSWNLAPRLAFAWAPRQGQATQPKTVIRGGFGVFYDRVGSDLALQARRFDGVHQQQYVVTSPEVLDQLRFTVDGVSGIPSTASLDAYRVPQAIRRLASGIETPVTYMSSLSLERQLPGGFTASVTGMLTNVRRMLRSRNINAPDPMTGAQPLGTTEAVYQYESTGRLNQSQIIFGLNNRMGRTVNLFARYHLGWAKSDTDGAGSMPANAYDLAAEYGPAGMDVRQRFVLGGNVRLPGDVAFSPFVIASSGSPYNITIGRDVNGDTVFTDRPAYASDPTKAGVIETAYGLLDPNPTAGETIIPRNLGRGPSFYVINLRLNKTFVLGRKPKPAEPAPQPQPGAPGQPQGVPLMPGGPGGGGHGPGGHGPGGGGPGGGGRGGWHDHLGQEDGKMTLTVSVNAQNLLNHVNPGVPVGNIASPLFGQSTSTAGGFGRGPGGGSPSAGNRRIELQVRVGF